MELQFLFARLKHFYQILINREVYLFVKLVFLSPKLLLKYADIWNINSLNVSGMAMQCNDFPKQKIRLLCVITFFVIIWKQNLKTCV